MKLKKRGLIGVAALLLLTPIVTFQVASAESITDFGSPDATATKEYGIYHKYAYSENGNAQTLYYMEYKPSTESDYEFVIHDVRNSSGGVTLSTVSDIAADYEADTGRQVLFATNGDFFDSTGYSIDSLVKDGEVIKTGTYTNKNAFGFDNNGNAVVGRVTETKDQVEFTYDGATYRLDIAGTNVVPTGDEISLYTTATGMTIDGCLKYKASLQGDSTLTTARPLELSCAATVKANKTLTLQTGQVALVAQEGSTAQELLSAALGYGTEIRVISAPAGNFSGMEYVVGGWDILVNEGEIVESTHSTTSDPNGGGYDAPRTLIGMKEDGTMFLAVIDGRQSGYSVGCTVAEEGRLALALGAKYALELDGGGSSTFLRSQDGEDLILCNVPSDGSQRKVSNAVLVVEKDKTKSAYRTLADYVPGGSDDGNSESSSGNGNSESDSETSEDSTQTGESSTENGGVSIEGLVSGCSSSLGGLSVVAGAAMIAAIAFMNKRRGE